MPQINLEHIKSTINEDFWEFINNKDRYQILRGGAGSGKSFAAAQKLILRVLFAQENDMVHSFACLRKTLPDVRKSVFSLIKHFINEWNLGSLVKINQTHMTFRFKNGSSIICLGLDNVEKLKSIQGPDGGGITGFWMEEATEFTELDFQQIDLRMRGNINDYYSVILSFNPISKSNWIYKTFYEDPVKIDKYKQRGLYEHHSTYRNNRFLDEQYIEVLQGNEEISPYHYAVYTLGRWGSLSGLIYDNWEKVDEMPKGPSIFGLDFGYNVPSALSEVKYVKKERSFYIKEHLYKEELTNKQLAYAIRRIIKPSNIVVCDSGSPDRIRELKEKGIRAVACRKGNDSVFDGIDFIKRHKIKVVKPSQNLINELTGYQWKTDKNNKPLDEPVKIDDHLCDSFRYPIYTKYYWNNDRPQLVFV
jgi:phage terminase large subunit